MVWAVLPLKDFVSAKQRLAGILASHERRRMFHCMVEDVLDVLADHPGVEQTVIVSDDPSAMLLAEHYGTECWSETALQARGLNGVVNAAAKVLAAQGVETLLVVHGDLPLLSAQELQQFIEQHEVAGAPVMSIAPDTVDDGSNCVLCSPPDAVAFQYGRGSFHKHRAAAAAAKMTFNRVTLAGAACDIDNPIDLKNLLDSDSGDRRTLRYLRESGIIERFRAMDIGVDDSGVDDSGFENHTAVENIDSTEDQSADLEDFSSKLSRKNLKPREAAL